MATILSSSDTAPLNSVTICCTTVTTRNILLRGWLFVFWTRTGWPDCWGCTGAESLCFFVGDRSGVVVWSACGCCCCVLPWSASPKETPGVARFDENTLPVVVLGVLWAFLLCSSSLASAAPIIDGMGFHTLRQLAVTASWSGGSVILLRALLVEVAAPAPQTTWRLLTVCPDVAELLAVVALCEAALGPVCLHPDHYVAEGR
jgi:hypothetical protein